MFLMNLWAQRSTWKGDSCWFLQILWEGQCWKEVFVLQDLIYILCIEIQIVKNQEKQLMLRLYSLWIFYLNVIFTFVSCVSCSCFSVSKKKRKKIYYTLQSFKCSQIISNQNRMDGEVCCILVWFCLSSFKYNSQLFWAQVIYQKKESMI